MLNTRKVLPIMYSGIRQYKTCIAGAGPTGAVAAGLIAPVAGSALPAVRSTASVSTADSTATKGVTADKVVIFEKSRGVGGRMSTSRASGAAAGGRCDTGAQYVTRFDHMKLLKSSVKDWFEMLVKAGVLQLMTAPVLTHRESHKIHKHYVAKEGMSSLVKYIMSQSTAELRCNKRVVSLDMSHTSEHEGGKPQWLVKCDDGSEEAFDAVVLSMPVPQILALTGDVAAVIAGAGVLKALEDVAYSSRYALALYFAPEDAEHLLSLFPFGGKFIENKDSDAIRYVGYDTLKRVGPSGLASNVPCIILHTSVEFGATYVDTDPSLVAPIILEQLQRLYPALPEVVESKCHRWRYSQVTRAYDGPEPYVMEAMNETPAKKALAVGAVAAGAAAVSRVGAVMVMDNPPLILAGDAFTSSNFEGCIASGEKAAMLLRQAVQSS